MDRQKVAKEAIANFDKSHPHSSSEAKNFYIAGWLDGVQRFYSLVKRMREAQNNSPYKYLTYCNNIEELRRLESEVDEYLKKMAV